MYQVVASSFLISLSLILQFNKEPETDMNTMFKPLEGDDNVILLDNDTFTVSRLKDLLKQQINKRFTENQIYLV
jgi:hypothetical protein